MADFYDRLTYHMRFLQADPPSRAMLSGALGMGGFFTALEKAVISGSETPPIAAAFAGGAAAYLGILAGSAAVAFCEVNNLPLPLALTYEGSMRVLKLPANIIAASLVNHHSRHLTSRLRLRASA